MTSRTPSKMIFRRSGRSPRGASVVLMVPLAR